VSGQLHPALYGNLSDPEISWYQWSISLKRFDVWLTVHRSSMCNKKPAISILIPHLKRCYAKIRQAEGHQSLRRVPQLCFQQRSIHDSLLTWTFWMNKWQYQQTNLISSLQKAKRFLKCSVGNLTHNILRNVLKTSRCRGFFSTYQIL